MSPPSRHRNRREPTRADNGMDDDDSLVTLFANDSDITLNRFVDDIKSALTTALLDVHRKAEIAWYPLLGRAPFDRHACMTAFRHEHPNATAIQTEAARAAINLASDPSAWEP